MNDIEHTSLQGTQGESSPEWTAEISRRIAAVSRGQSTLIPGDEVEARIRRALDLEGETSR